MIDIGSCWVPPTPSTQSWLNHIPNSEKDPAQSLEGVNGSMALIKQRAFCRSCQPCSIWGIFMHIHLPNLSKYRSGGAQRWMIAMTCQPSDLRPLSATIAYLFSAQQGTWNFPSVFVFWDPDLFCWWTCNLSIKAKQPLAPTLSPPVDQPVAPEASKDFPLHIADCTLCYSAPWLLCALEVCASLKPPEPLASALLCKSFWRILDRKIDSLDLLHAETSDRFMHQTTWCSWIHICGIHAKLLITRP